MLRLKDLLGLSLDELREVMAGEDARAERRRAWHAERRPGERGGCWARRRAHVDALLELVRPAQGRLEAFEAELLRPAAPGAQELAAPSALGASEASS